MKIAIDTLGSDRGPQGIVRGCAEAVKLNPEIEPVFFGREAEVKRLVAETGYDFRYEIVNCDVEITMQDSATCVLKEKSESSMAMGLHAVSDGRCAAFVSSGNSGALITGATFIVKRIKGIKRPAFAPILPSVSGGTMLMDAGANTEVRPEFLMQFGLMGSIYMSKMMKKDNIKVGLVSNGIEEKKGTEATREARIMMENAGYNFVGYIEGNDIINGGVDVAVTDGFTGNIVLKALEGLGKFINANIKMLFKASPISMLSAVLVSGGLEKFKKRFDSREYGGAVVLGVRAPVIKAHGSADELAIKKSVLQAAEIVSCNIINEISLKIDESTESKA